MAKCQIEGCNSESYYNHITKESNIVCSYHLKKIKNPTTRTKTLTSKLPAKRGDKPPFAKSKPAVKTVRPELFVLRGNTLTVNYSGKTMHFKVDRYTRAVKYNADREGSSGKMFHYVIDVKQGSNNITNILFDTKAERDREFAKLQAMLSNL
jgi:hypothetical protein